MAQDWFATNAPQDTTPKGGGDDWFASNAPKPDLTANDNGEGTYEMEGPGGKKVKIPYSMISTASQAGYKMTAADRDRYVEDAKADPNLGQGVVGKNSAGQDIHGQKQENALDRFASSEFGALKDAGKGIVQFLNPNPSEEEKQRGQTGVYDTIVRYPNRLVQPHVDQALQAEAAAKKAVQTGDWKDVSEAIGHGLATVTPVVGPYAAQVGEKMGQQAGEGNYAGAAGTAVGNAIVSEAPKVAKGVLSAAKTGAGDFLRTKSGSESVRDLVKETQKGNAAEDTRVIEANAANTEKHLGDTLNALQETREREDIYSASEKARKEKLDAKNEDDRKKFNESELDRIKTEGQARVDALERNKDKIDKYKDKLAKVKAENIADYRREIARQNVEAKLNSASKILEEKYNAVKTKARNDYNATWNKWREKIKGARADMTPTVDVINAQAASMDPQRVTQFREILRESSPDDDALTGVERREQFSQQAFKETYDKLNPNQKAVIDKDVAERGLDLTDQGLKDVPAERLHAWKSQLERAVRSTQDGTIRYAIGKVLDRLRMTEEDVSKTVGPDALKQLVKARAITGPYFDAFVKSPTDYAKAAEQSLREQTPEYVKERNEQARLDRIAAYDPSLKSAANTVAELRESLSKIEPGKTAKELTPLPPPPMGSVVRPSGVGVSLNSPSLPPRPTHAGEFQPKPFEPNIPPERATHPDRPPEVNPEYKKVGEKDIIEAKKNALHLTAKWLRHRANWIASGLVLSKVPYNVLHGDISAVADDVMMSAVANVITGKIGDWIENPHVQEWLTKPNAKDVAEIMKLPPEQRGELAGTWKPIIEQAEAKGVKVAPLLKQALTTVVRSGASQKKEGPKDLLGQVQDLQKSFQQGGFAR